MEVTDGQNEKTTHHTKCTFLWPLQTFYGLAFPADLMEKVIGKHFFGSILGNMRHSVR